MKYPVLLYLIALIIVNACQQAPKKTIDDQVLFSVDGDPVTAEEFIYVYEKNNFNNDSIYSENDIKDYLDLFINFKLKVKQAEAEGFDTTEAFNDEFNQYKSQLLMPYLSRSKAIDTLIREAYERSQYLVNASHILIRCEDSASPEDTLEAYNKIVEIRQEAVDGADFGKLAKEHSEDPSAKQNEGDLGYFSSFKMVYPFESAAFTTPVGEVSDIVRTQFGYHILKVHDKKPTKGSAQAAHIMLSFKNHDSLEARNMAFDLYDQLQAGGDWSKLCAEFSDDVRTKNNGGSLSTVRHGQLPPQLLSFENAIFNLDTAGQISDPVKTPYGWHIVKLIEHMPPQPFEEVKDNLETKVKRDSRAEYTKKQVVESLKDKAGFTENTQSYDSLKAKADNTLVEGKWEIAELKQDTSTMFSVDDKRYTIGDFVQYVDKEQSRQNKMGHEAYLEKLYNDFVEQTLIDYEEQIIKRKNKDYRMLVKEYREGILLFEMMEKYVWSKANNDSAGIRAYYDNHKEDYMWRERADLVMLSSDSEDVLERAAKQLDHPYYTVADQALNVNKDDNALRKAINDLAQAVKQTESSFIEIQMNTETSDELLSDVVKRLESKGVDEQDIVTKRGSIASDFIFKVNSRSVKSLEKQFNQSSSLTLQVENGKYEREDKAMFDQMDWKPGEYTFKHNDRFYLVKVNEIIPAQPKSLKDTRGKVISDYQDKLEKEWLASLKAQYSVQVNQDVLSKIIDHFEE